MGKKKGEKMSLGLVKSAIDMVNSLSNLTQKVMDAGDPEKYSESIERLHQGVAESYDMMRQIVQNDDSLTADEKIEKLKKIAEDEETSKKKCGEALEGHREKTAQIAITVLKGFLTCGLSFTPAIIKSIKGALDDKDDVVVVPEPDAIGEKSENETD